MSTRIQFSRLALKQLPRLPRHVLSKLKSWVDLVEKEGLEHARLIPGYHDEPLRGKLRRYRSIRLSRGYRALYSLKDMNHITTIYITEVNKHEY